MTPRSLWLIILKLIGISILIDALSVVPQSVSSAMLVGQTYSDDGSVSIVISLLIILLALGIYLLAIWAFLFKTETIIDWLRLDKHFTEEKIEITIHRSTAVQIGIIIVGGLIFADSLPILCRQIIIFFQGDIMFRESPEAGWIIFYFLEAVVGYLLMTNSRWVTNWIEYRRQEREGGKS